MKFHRVVVTGIIFLAVVGCKSAASRMAGTWEVASPFSGKIVFNKSGGFERQQIDSTQVESGTYSLDGEKLTLHVQHSLAGPRDESYKATWDGPDGLKLTYIPDSAEKGITPAMAAAFAFTIRRMSPAEKLVPMTPVAGGASGPDPDSQCVVNVKEIAMGLTMYSQDYDEMWPASSWQESITPYVKNPSVMSCPTVVKNGGTGGYAFNPSLWRAQVSSVTAANTPMIYESTAPGADASADFYTVPNPPRHPKGNTVGYADGHVVSLR
jgi:prepilin-type processing-associated H-X9-DG protein